MLGQGVVRREGVVLLLIFALTLADNTDPPFAILQVAIGSATAPASQTLFAQASTFGGYLPATPAGPGLLLRVAEDTSDTWGFACGAVTPPSGGVPFAVLASRGNCSFAAKALSAQLAGASLLAAHRGSDCWRASWSPRWLPLCSVC